MPTFDTRRPFTRADALAAGVPAKDIRGSRFRRVFTGVYVDATLPDSPFVRAEAALLVHPSTAFVSHTTAAAVYGVPVPHRPEAHVTVQDKGERSRRKDIRCHVGRTDQVVEVAGVRVSSPVRMLVELASMLSLVDLVVVGDALVRLGLVEPEALRTGCVQSGERFASAAARAAGYVRRGVDSPMETRLRMLIVLAGLPEPDVNHKIRDEYGHVVRRFDLCYPDVRLVVEYDGRQHVEDRAQWNSDRIRREELDDGGWRLLVVTSEGIYQNPGATVARIMRVLRQRGHRPLPPRLSDGWQTHFPGRR